MKVETKQQQGERILNLTKADADIYARRRAAYLLENDLERDNLGPKKRAAIERLIKKLQNADN